MEDKVKELGIELDKLPDNMKAYLKGVVDGAELKKEITEDKK